MEKTELMIRGMRELLRTKKAWKMLLIKVSTGQSEISFLKVMRRV